MLYPAGASVPPASGGAIGGGADCPPTLPVLLLLALEFVLASPNDFLRPSLTRVSIALEASVVEDFSPSSMLLLCECRFVRFAGWLREGPAASPDTPPAPVVGAESYESSASASSPEVSCWVGLLSIERRLVSAVAREPIRLRLFTTELADEDMMMPGG